MTLPPQQWHLEVSWLLFWLIFHHLDSGTRRPIMPVKQFNSTLCQRNADGRVISSNSSITGKLSFKLNIWMEPRRQARAGKFGVSDVNVKLKRWRGKEGDPEQAGWPKGTRRQCNEMWWKKCALNLVLVHCQTPEDVSFYIYIFFDEMQCFRMRHFF